MLDAMADHGLVGLAIWPEDLRHPFAWDSTGGPLLRAEDFQGKNIWTLPSSLQSKAMEGRWRHSRVRRVPEKLAAAGTVRGAESGLATGALALGGGSQRAPAISRSTRSTWCWVAEDAAWSRLSPAQQDAIRRAARAAERNSGPGPSDGRGQRAAYCAAGGKVVLAGSDNVATFERAVGPMIERMRQDAVTANGDRRDPGAQGLDSRRLRRHRMRRRLSARRPRWYRSSTARRPPSSRTASIGPLRTRQELLARGLNAFDAGNNSGTWTLRLTGGVGTGNSTTTTARARSLDLTFTLRDDHPAQVRGPSGGMVRLPLDARRQRAGDQVRGRVHGPRVRTEPARKSSSGGRGPRSNDALHLSQAGDSASRAIGMVAARRVPVPGADATFSVPPIAATRSSRPSKPDPRPGSRPLHRRRRRRPRWRSPSPRRRCGRVTPGHAGPRSPAPPRTRSTPSRQARDRR